MEAGTQSCTKHDISDRDRQVREAENREAADRPPGCCSSQLNSQALCTHLAEWRLPAERNGHCCLRKSDLKRQNKTKKNPQKTKQNAHYGYIFKYQVFSPTYLVAKILPDALPSYARCSITSRRGGRERARGCLQHGPQCPQKARTGSFKLLPESPAQPVSLLACGNA